MKHLFVSYNIALLAKEKGFWDYCLSYYTKDGILVAHLYKCHNKESHMVNMTCAPLYQQLIDWMLKKFKTEKHEHYARIVIYHDNSGYWEFGQGEDEDGVYFDNLDKALEEAFKLI